MYRKATTPLHHMQDLERSLQQVADKLATNGQFGSDKYFELMQAKWAVTLAISAYLGCKQANCRDMVAHYRQIRNLGD